MATKQHAAIETYHCPNCGGTLTLVGGSWGCTDCRYVPEHGAD